MSQTVPPRYLGDGVYASFDGFQVWLATTTAGHESRIAIEPATFSALTAFVQAIAKGTDT